MINNNFVKLKKSLFTSSLSDAEFRVLGYIISRSKNGYCFPSIRTIAADLHKSNANVQKCLKSLEQQQYIIKENRKLGTGKNTSNLYVINDECLVNKNASHKEEVEEVKELFDYDWINDEGGDFDE